MGFFRHFVLLAIIVLNVSNGEEAKCGYESCNKVKEGHVNIHLVPHSHDDLGWLKTYEQYYYGSHDNIYSAGVQYILNSVIDALQKDPERRFIYVETGFFWKWWLHQDENIRTQVKQLVNEGRLEFISGGWSMNDEATTYYQTIIDQMSWGLRKLNETFGECGRPKVAWQIDPFGHSREMASLFAQIGFDGFFLNRIDYQDHKQRIENKSLEFVWRGSPDHLGESSDIYTNVLFKHYSAPGGLCFDVYCTDEPIIDDKESPEYNVDQKAEDFINNWINPARKAHVSDNLLVTMGDDFQYQYAGKNFVNMDKLIKYMNGKEFNGVKYNVIYSTPSCYLHAVHQATNGTLQAPLKTDDFFPYASSEHNYWTGYFTSRPTSKGYGRYSNNFLQVCKQLSAITNMTSEENSKRLDTLREALGVFQHHDAITGTEKENVTHDYIRILHNGMERCEEVTSQALSKLTKSNNSFTTCHYLNISECATVENEDKLVITVYNPLGKSVTKYVRLPAIDNTTGIIITDPSGKQLVTQRNPIHPAVLKVPGRNSSAKYDLYFVAENIPPMGYKQFFYERNPKYPLEAPIVNNNIDNGERYIDITETDTGSKTTITNRDGIKLSIGTAYYYYTGYVGNASSNEFSPSQPYVFRPDPTIPLKAIPRSGNSVIYYGPVLTETHNYFNEWFSYVRRNYVGSRLSEFNHLVGPLPYEKKGIEVIIRFNTDMTYDDKIFTDSNGRELIERKRNYRPTWNVSISEPVSGNYYPIVSSISFQKDNTTGLAFITDRAQGGGSIDYQRVEFMIHRNTINTGGGVGEPLNEQAFGTGVVSRGTHYLVSTGTDYASYKAETPKEISQQVYLDSWIFFSIPKEQSFENYNKSHNMQYSGMSTTKLPRNVHILTLEPWGPSTVLLRLENFVGKEDPRRYGTATVNVQTIFSAFTVKSLEETTLAANQWLKDNKRIMFNRAADTVPKVQDEHDFNVTLDPLQIRTFVVTISY